MEEKIKEKGMKEKLKFWKTFLAVSIIFLMNIWVYLSNYRRVEVVTGLSVGETVGEAYNNIPISARIFIGIQWALLVSLLIFAYYKDREVKKKENEIEGVDLKEMSKNSKTDLDTLYNILKEKKQLRISTLAKLFNLNEEVVMGWCRTLELNNLVTITDHSTGGAIVRIIE